MAISLHSQSRRYRRESTKEEWNIFGENKMCFRVVRSDDGSFSFARQISSSFNGTVGLRVRRQSKPTDIEELGFDTLTANSLKKKNQLQFLNLNITFYHFLVKINMWILTVTRISHMWILILPKQGESRKRVAQLKREKDRSQPKDYRKKTP